MLKFGLACEGITDHAVLESILFGFFDELDDGEITKLQPLEPTKGGWGTLTQYLAHSRFSEDLTAVNYIIIQIDTDIAEKLDIQQHDADGNKLSDVLIVTNTIQKLNEIIEANNQDSENLKSKVIYAICVESIECWLINSHARNDTEICEHSDKCFDTLKELVNAIGGLGSVKKKRAKYLKLSKHFEEDRNRILELAERDYSFSQFLERLQECETG